MARGGEAAAQRDHAGRYRYGQAIDRRRPQVLKPRRIPGLREPAAVYLPDAFVIDCSVCVPWYLRDEASQFCDQLGLAVHRSEVWVPSLWRPELVSAVVNAERRKRMTREQRSAVLKNADGLPLRIDHEMPSVVELNELAAGHDLTP